MVNTLELRGIETYSPEIQTFLREIEKSFLQVLNNCVPADQQEKEAIQLRQRVSATDNETKLFSRPQTFWSYSCHRLPVTQLDGTNSSRYTYNYHYHTWCKDPSVDDFELNYLEIQPMLLMRILSGTNKARLFRVSPRLSCGVFLRVISLG